MKNNLYSWIYSLGMSIMLFGYKRMPYEERKETCVYGYVVGGKGQEKTSKYPFSKKLNNDIADLQRKGEMLLKEIKMKGKNEI